MATAKSFLPLVTLGLGLALGYGAKGLKDQKETSTNAKLGLSEDMPVQSFTGLPSSGKAEPEAVNAVAASLEEQGRIQAETIAQLRQDLEAKSAEIARRESEEKLPPVDDTPEERERLANEMLDLTNSKEQIEMTFATLSKTMVKEAGPVPQEEVEKLLNKYYSWDVMGKTFVKIYSDVFSVEDLQRINRFYQSESGRMLLEKQPELMQKTISSVQEINQKALPKLNEEMERLLKKGKTAAPAQVGR